MEHEIWIKMKRFGCILNVWIRDAWKDCIESITLKYLHLLMKWKHYYMVHSEQVMQEKKWNKKNHERYICEWHDPGEELFLEVKSH